MENAQAYGAGMSGGAFDPVAFIKKPQVILRIVSWVWLITCIYFKVLRSFVRHRETFLTGLF